MAPAFGLLFLALLSLVPGGPVVAGLLPLLAGALCWREFPRDRTTLVLLLAQVSLATVWVLEQGPHDGPACLLDGRRSYTQLLSPGHNPFYLAVGWAASDFPTFQAAATLLGSLLFLPLAAALKSPGARLLAWLLLVPLGLPHCLLLRPACTAAALVLAGVLLGPGPRAAFLIAGGLLTDLPAALGALLVALLYRRRVSPWMAYLPLLALRGFLCWQPPSTTTDCLRNLGYSSHFWELGPSLYTTVGRDFQPEPWATCWPNLSFPYPPVTLLFFAIFSGLGLGTVAVKLALTGCEFLVSRAFARSRPGWGPLYFASPMSLWWCSHEGQFEPLVAALVALSVLTRRWLLAGFLLALAVQSKQLALLALPWLLWRGRGRFLGGFALGCAPFLPFYLTCPDLLARPFQVMWQLPYNPYTGHPLTLAMLVLALATLRFSTLGWTAGWLLIQFGPLAMPWYLLLLPVFLLGAADRPRVVTAFLVLFLLVPLHHEFRGSSTINEQYRFHYPAKGPP